jgi:AraC-like DNA-binding protein
MLLVSRHKSHAENVSVFVLSFCFILESMMQKPINALLYGIDTPHDLGFIANRPKPRPDWVILCFRTPFLIQTKQALEMGEIGDCIVHDANFSEWHTTLSGESQGFRNDWLHVSTQGMKELSAHYQIPLNQRIPTGLGAFLSDHLRVIANEERRQELFWQERISLEIQTLLLKMGRAWAHHQLGEDLSGTERNHRNQLGNIRSMMLDRFDEPWTVSALAALAEISPNRFSVLYKHFFKISPIEELIQHRLKQSCTLLIYSDTNLEGIAEACGFTDASYFSRVFKQRIGCNPGAYRTIGTHS